MCVGSRVGVVVGVMLTVRVGDKVDSDTETVDRVYVCVLCVYV